MFDAGTIQASLELNRDAFQEGLRQAAEEIREFTNRHYEAKIHVITEAPEKTVEDYANDATAHVRINADSDEAQDEIDKLGDGQEADVKVNADTGEAEEKIDHLSDEAHHVKMDVDLNDAEAKTRLDALSEERRKAHLDVDLDDEEAKARLTKLEDTRRIAKLTVRADTSEAKAQIAALRKEISGLHADVKVGTEASKGGSAKAGAEGAEGGMGKMLAGLSVVGPALAPLAGGMAVFGAATAAAMAQGGLAIGAFAAIAKSDFSDLQTALKKAKGNVNALPPALREAGAAYQSMSKSMDSVKKATDPAVYGVMTNAFHQASRLLPEIVPLVNATAHGLNGTVSTLGNFMAGPQVKGFLSVVAAHIGPAIKSITNDLVLFGSGAIALMEKLEPAIAMVGHGISIVANDFAKWANSKESTKQIDTLIGAFKQAEPLFKSIGTDLKATLKNLGTAIGPMIQPALKFITEFVHQLPGISKGLAPVGKGLGQLMTALQPLLPALGKIAMQALPELGRNLQSFAKFLTPVVKDLVSFTQKLGPIPKLLLEMLVIGKVTKAVGEFTGVTKGLTSVAGGFKTVHAAAKEGEGISGFFSKLKDGDGAMKAFGIAGMGVTKTTKGIGRGLKALGSPFAEFGRGFKQGAAEAGGFGNALKSRAGQAVDGFKGKLKGVAGGFAEFGRGFKEGSNEAGGFGNALKARGSMIIDGFKGKLKTAGSALKDFGGKITESGGKMKTFASAAKDVASSGISSGFSKIGDVVKGIGGKLKTAATAVKEFGIGEKIVTGLTKLWEGAQAALDLVMDANPIFLIVAAIVALGIAFYEAYKHSATFRHFVQGMWNGIKKAAEAVWNWLKSTWGTIEHVLGDAVKGAGKAISKVWDTIKNSFKTVVDFIKNHWKGILSVLTGPIGAAVIFIATHWKQIQKGASEIVDWIKTHWKQILNFLTTPIRDAVKIIQKGWDDVKRGASIVWDAIKNAVKSAWDAIKNTISNAIHGVGHLLSTEWDNIKRGATIVWDAIKSAISNAWNAIKNTVSNAIHNVENVLSSVWNAIKSTIENVWNTIKSTISNVWNSIKNTISNAAHNVESFLSNAWNTIKNTMSNAWNTIKNTLSNAWNSIVNTVRSKAGDVISFVSSLPGKIKSALGNLGNLLVSAGSDLINGLVHGIENAAGGAMSAISNTVGNMVKTAMSFIPHSPAKQGPLSGAGWTKLLESGTAFAKQWAGGIDAGSVHVKNAAAKVAALAANTPLTAHASVMLDHSTLGGDLSADSTLTLKPNTEQLAAQRQSTQTMEAMLLELRNMRAGIGKMPENTGKHVSSAVADRLYEAAQQSAILQRQANRARG